MSRIQLLDYKSQTLLKAISNTPKSNKLKHVGAGIFGMVKAGNTQFYITTAPLVNLDIETDKYPTEYIVLGRICSGMNIVQRISISEVDALDRPINDIKINNIVIEEMASNVD